MRCSLKVIVPQNGLLSTLTFAQNFGKEGARSLCRFLPSPSLQAKQLLQAPSTESLQAPHVLCFLGPTPLSSGA